MKDPKTQTLQNISKKRQSLIKTTRTKTKRKGLKRDVNSKKKCNKKNRTVKKGRTREKKEGTISIKAVVGVQQFDWVCVHACKSESWLGITRCDLYSRLTSFCEGYVCSNTSLLRSMYRVVFSLDRCYDVETAIMHNMHRNISVIFNNRKLTSSKLVTSAKAYPIPMTLK